MTEITELTVPAASRPVEQGDPVARDLERFAKMAAEGRAEIPDDYEAEIPNELFFVRGRVKHPAPAAAQPVAWAYEYNIPNGEGVWERRVTFDKPRDGHWLRSVEPLFRLVSAEVQPVAWAWEAEYAQGWLLQTATEKPQESEWVRNIRPLYAHPAPAASRPAVGREEIADDAEIDRILALSGDELRAELIAEGHDPDEMVRKQKLGLDGLLRLAADRSRWRAEAGSWRRVAERLEEEKQASVQATKAWSKLKPCPEEANEALCCFPSCNCSVDRLSYPAPAASQPAVGRDEIARAMARHQIELNRFAWAPRNEMSPESLRRAEDAGWKQFEGFAGAVFALLVPRDDTRAGGADAQEGGR